MIILNKFLYLIILILVPITVVSFNKKETNFFNEEENNENTINVNIYDKINNIPLEEYIIGVVSGEMPASFEPEALKAQAIASRTYAINHLKTHDNISSTTDDQVYLTKEEMQEKWQDKYDFYYEKIKNAVEETKGLVMTYNNEVIKSYYYSESNGYTEDSINVFNEENDYLKIKENPYDNPETKEITMSKNEFCTNLSITCDLLTITNITKDESNHISTIVINNKKFTGIEVRKLLNLRSTDFEIIEENDNIIIKTKGYGHGVGMSQYGANNMAKQGKNYEEILKYYYENVEISNI